MATLFPYINSELIVQIRAREKSYTRTYSDMKTVPGQKGGKSYVNAQYLISNPIM